jgi:hypothetical protein
MAKKLVAGQEIGKALIEALGLPKLTRSFELCCAVDEAVSVKCEYYPEVDGQELVVSLAEYELVRRDVPLKPEAIDFDAWLNARKEAAHAEMQARHAELSRMDERQRLSPAERLSAQMAAAIRRIRSRSPG